MAEESYRIVFRGKLVDGVSRAEAEANLKSRFKYSESALAKLFAGKGVVLKGGLDRVTAEKYENALKGVGLVCEIQPVGAVEVAEPETTTREAETAPVAAREEPVAQPEPPAETVATPAEPEEKPEESADAAQPETSYESEDVFVTGAAEYAPDQEEESVYTSANDSEDAFETETTTVPEEERESVYASATDSWNATEDVFGEESSEPISVQQEDEESAAAEATDTWGESEVVFGEESAESIPVRDEAEEEEVSTETTDTWSEAEEGVFEAEATESISVQAEADEAEPTETVDSWDETEDVFGSTIPESAAVREMAEEPSMPPAESVVETEEDFAVAPTSAAAEAEDSFFEEFPAAGGSVNATILELMKQTKPWVRLISVLLFVSAGFGVLAIGVVLLGGMMGGLGNVADTPTMLMFVFQMLSMLLYLIPAYYLFKYASAIGTLLQGGGESDLEAALGYQKSFWRFSGILTLICLVLGALGVAAAILIPIMLR